MALPEPLPGLVVRYSYLWHSEFREGREDGVKDRPCAIVAAMKVDAEGDIRVLVLPVTHSPPSKETPAVEIPPAIKKQLKLDADRSWIVVSEWNEFVWPGPDLRRGAQGSIAYGFLPRVSLPPYATASLKQSTADAPSACTAPSRDRH